MKKFTISLVVIIIAALVVWLVVRNRNSIAQPATDIATNVQVTGEPLADTVPTDETNITNQDNNKKVTKATLKTNKGDITVEFFDGDAPKTVENFTKLAKEGFYDKTKFHRVIKGFMIQGGDPLTKDDTKVELWGRGDPGYKFADEIDAKSDLYTKVGYKKGIVAMANSGPHTNGSQFFIMHEDYPLPPSYVIFGKVTSGQDVIDKIANVPTTGSPNDRPLDPVIVNSISVN